MRITCPKCNHAAEVDESVIPTGTTSVRCNACSTRFPLSLPSTAAKNPIPKETTEDGAAQRSGLNGRMNLDETVADRKPTVNPVPGGSRKELRSDGIRKFSALRIPYLSFFSKALYRDACFVWKGTGFVYLLALLAVCWLPTMVKMHYSVSSFIGKNMEPIISRIPQITFSDGSASVDVPQPYIIKSPQTNKDAIIIDTTGTITSLKGTEAFVLVKRNEAIFKKNDVETRTFDFKNFKQYVLNQQKMRSWTQAAQRYFAVFFYPCAVAGSFIFRILQMLVYAAIGMLFASWCRATFSYDSLLRLSVVAVTPCIIINKILGLAGVLVPFAGLLSFLVTMFYLFVGVRESARHAAQEANYPDC